MKDKTLNSSGKQNTLDVVRRFAKPLLAIVLIVFILELYINNTDKEKVPAVAEGNVVTFQNEFSKHASISKIEANEDYIFVLYERYLSAVAIYDMTGAYHHSLAFSHIPNTVLHMWQNNGLLYVEQARYLYIFEDCNLVDSFEQTGSLVHNKSNDSTVTIANGNIYNLDGEFIMPLPGRF